jgi:hypothetical protein
MGKSKTLYLSVNQKVDPETMTFEEVCQQASGDYRITPARALTCTSAVPVFKGVPLGRVRLLTATRTAERDAAGTFRSRFTFGQVLPLRGEDLDTPPLRNGCATR